MYIVARVDVREEPLDEGGAAVGGEADEAGGLRQLAAEVEVARVGQGLADGEGVLELLCGGVVVDAQVVGVNTFIWSESFDRSNLPLLPRVKSWGFDVSAITVPVAVWQGDEDLMVPAAHGRGLAGHVAGPVGHLEANGLHPRRLLTDGGHRGRPPALVDRP